MTQGKATINKSYKNNKAYIKIKGVILNPENMRQFPLSFDCRIDTGFDGGILIPAWYISDARSIGVEPRPTNITLADGRTIPAHVCVAHIQEIDVCSFPLPGKPVMLVICGGRKTELLGMGTLKYCTVLFDGPNQAFTMNL